MEVQTIFDYVEDNHYNYRKVFDKTDFPIRLFEAFAGIGCQAMAFNRNKFPYVSVGISEIDKYAIKSYEAIHGETENYGDISKMTEIPPCDIFTWSFPCTDLSKAGKQKGLKKALVKTEIDMSVFENVSYYNTFDCLQEEIRKLSDIELLEEYETLESSFDYLVSPEHHNEYIKMVINEMVNRNIKIGTRSGLVYEVLRLLHATEQKPKVLIMENVVDLVQVKFMAEFYEIQKEIESLGYKNYTQTLNAKNYGVAQNRDRVFMVSILGDYHYEFPPRIPLEKRLKDYLESNVDEKYYLTEKAIKGIQNTKFQVTANRIQDQDWCDTLCARDYKDPKCVIDEPKVIRYAHGYHKGGEVTNEYSPTIDGAIGARYTAAIVEPKLHKVAQMEGKHEESNRVYSNEGISPTINTCGGGNREPKILEEPICLNSKVNGKQPSILDGRPRKLTPKECWRLMGIDDSDFEKAQKIVSNSQLYKQAGNGIVVDVFANILKGLIDYDPNPTSRD